MSKAWALIRFSRLGMVLKDWAVVMALIIWVGARPTASFQTLWAALTLFVTLAFMHMINDLEDADEDAQDPAKVDRNPVSSGALSRREAVFATALTGTVAAVMHLALPLGAMVVGMSVWSMGLLYSWRPVRLKAIPGLDIISHSYGGGAGLVLFFAVLDGSTFDVYTVVAMIGSFLGSMGGCLYNQTRDWEVDRLAELDNSAHRLGYRSARRAMISSYALGGSLLVIGGVKFFQPWIRETFLT